MPAPDPRQHVVPIQAGLSFIPTMLGLGQNSLTLGVPQVGGPPPAPDPRQRNVPSQAFRLPDPARRQGGGYSEWMSVEDLQRQGPAGYPGGYAGPEEGNEQPSWQVRPSFLEKGGGDAGGEACWGVARTQRAVRLACWGALKCLMLQRLMSGVGGTFGAMQGLKRAISSPAGRCGLGSLLCLGDYRGSNGGMRAWV